MDDVFDFDNDPECAVCRSDTPLLCSCGDPVCHHCECPNGCAADAEMPYPVAA